MEMTSLDDLYVKYKEAIRTVELVAGDLFETNKDLSKELTRALQDIEDYVEVVSQDTSSIQGECGHGRCTPIRSTQL